MTVEDLTVGFESNQEQVKLLSNINFSIKEGETLGIVGESGCGKSLTSLSVMGLLPNPLRILSGKIKFKDNDLTLLGNKEINKLRGNEMAMIFQEPMTSLNPVFTIGNQIMEPIIAHLKVSKKEALDRAIELLNLVGIPAAESRVHEYPHQLSGGMRQRVMIAMMLACQPKLLIADEPTTALDVTIQSQILDLLQEMKERFNMSLIFITHDLGVLAKMADRVLVMYGGRVVESAPFRDIFKDPLHPYTKGLWKAIPKSDGVKQRLYTIPGNVPNPKDKISGCRFASRCEFVSQRCLESEPPLVKRGTSHKVACFLYEEWEEEENNGIKSTNRG